MDNSFPDNQGKKICGLCDQKASKYCCPRCEVFYCSLECYKCEKHADCAENFYRDCITEELTGNHTNHESQRKMIEILKRVNQGSINEDEDIQSLLEDVENGLDEGEIDSDDEDDIDLLERVKNLNLDDADALWDALTQDERNEFEALLNQGNVDSLIPQWEPWWSYRKKDKLVSDANGDNEESVHVSKCPALVNVPEFCILTKVKPSPSIRFNITNCTASYVLVMRYFNGEINSLEAASYMYTLCDNLSKNVTFTEVELAVESVAQNCLQSNLIQTDAESIEVMRQDVLDIFKGPSKEHPSFYCKSVLSHMHAIFDEARKSIKTVSKAKERHLDFSKKFPEHSTEHLPEIEPVKLKSCLKKIEFYLSFLNSVS